MSNASRSPWIRRGGAWSRIPGDLRQGAEQAGVLGGLGGALQVAEPGLDGGLLVIELGEAFLDPGAVGHGGRVGRVRAGGEFVDQVLLRALDAPQLGPQPAQLRVPPGGMVGVAGGAGPWRGGRRGPGRTPARRKTLWSGRRGGVLRGRCFPGSDNTRTPPEVHAGGGQAGTTRPWPRPPGKGCGGAAATVTGFPTTGGCCD